MKEGGAKHWRVRKGARAIYGAARQQRGQIVLRGWRELQLIRIVESLFARTLSVCKIRRRAASPSTARRRDKFAFSFSRTTKSQNPRTLSKFQATRYS